MKGKCVRFRRDMRENEYSIAAVSTALRPASPPSGCSSINRCNSADTTVAGTSFTGGMAICIASGCPASISSNSPKSAPARDAGTSAWSINVAASANRSESVSPSKASDAYGIVSQFSTSRPAQEQCSGAYRPRRRFAQERRQSRQLVIVQQTGITIREPRHVLHVVPNQQRWVLL